MRWWAWHIRNAAFSACFIALASIYGMVFSMVNISSSVIIERTWWFTVLSIFVIEDKRLVDIIIMMTMMAREVVGASMGKKGLRCPTWVIVTLGDYDFLRTGMIVNAEWTELHLNHGLNAAFDTLRDGSSMAWRRFQSIMVSIEK